MSMVVLRLGESFRWRRASAEEFHQLSFGRIGTNDYPYQREMADRDSSHRKRFLLSANISEMLKVRANFRLSLIHI